MLLGLGVLGLKEHLRGLLPSQRLMDGAGAGARRGDRDPAVAGVGAEGSFCVSKLERECAELSLLPPAWSPPTPGAGLTLGALLLSETASVPTY